ncbi:MAG: cupin domain-containing protein [Flavobacteriaceae bacterium]|nr:cupin domain-containing protein [Flavobacteriaceae bacterium]
MTQGQIVIACNVIQESIDFYSEIGFRLEQIYPSDDPAVAIISGHGLVIRLDRTFSILHQTIHIVCEQPEVLFNRQTNFVAPEGTTIKIIPEKTGYTIPDTLHKFEVKQLKENDSWVIGRAGMLYRDLIPDRLGGSIIASHIHIPNGGPVPDMVHYHTIGFQLIFCYQGWVKLVYEDQGQPFILKAGDCVTQPPEIRHRVLEASDNLQVIEIGIPSDHITTIDHDMELPNNTYNPDRLYQGQTFCHHQSETATWLNWKLKGMTYRDSGIWEATNQVADVKVVKAISSEENKTPLQHQFNIQFAFIMHGEIDLKHKDSNHKLKIGDAFVVPPYEDYYIEKFTENSEILIVSIQ